MKEKIAEEFYQLVEWLKTRNETEEVLDDFLDSMSFQTICTNNC